MIGGLDDGDDPHSLVALEAMVGLTRLMDLVDEVYLPIREDRSLC